MSEQAGASVLHMGDAFNVFNSLKRTQLDAFLINGHLGAMGATRVEVYDSKVGDSILVMEMANGGASLHIYSNLDHYLANKERHK